MRVLWVAPAFKPYLDNDSLSTSDYLSCAWKALADHGVTQYAILPPGSHSVDLDYTALAGGTMQDDATLPKGAAEDDGSALSRMLELAVRIQADFDVVINLGHDLPPHRLMETANFPLVSAPNLCNANRPTDQVIAELAKKDPRKFLWSSSSQMHSYGIKSGNVVGQPFNKDAFPEQDNITGGYLLFAGRLTPEKGLHRAASVARKTGLRLLVAGSGLDNDYVRKCQLINPDMEMMGDCNRTVLFGLMAGAEALLQLHSTSEAFGRVTAEALLCGCPVIHSDCGATSEIAGRSDGFVVESIDAAVDAAQKIIVNPVDRRGIQIRAMGRFCRSVYADKLLSLLKQTGALAA